MMSQVLDRVAGELKLLNSRRQAIRGIQMRIRLLESDAAGIGCLDFDRPRVNSKQKKNGKRLGTVEERDKLYKQERALKGWIEHMEQTLSQMHPDDEKILRIFYCENRRSGDAVRLLESELHVSQAAVYRMRERALEEFAARLGYLV